MDEGSLVLPRAILFDMDGTITRPMLDFPRIKAEIGIGSRPILEALAEMSPARRAEAEGVLLRHEHAAARGSTLNAGCQTLLEQIRELEIRTALITRNSSISVETVLRLHGLTFEVLIAREDAPPKPSPDALHAACRRLGVDERDAWMVGDGQYDVEAGMASGIRTVWVSHARDRPFAASPWRTVTDLCDLSRLLIEAQGRA